MLTRISPVPELGRYIPLLDDCLVPKGMSTNTLLQDAIAAEQQIFRLAGGHARGYYVDESIPRLAKATAIVSLRTALVAALPELPVAPSPAGQLALARVPLAGFAVVAAALGDSPPQTLRNASQGLASAVRGELLLALAQLTRKAPDVAAVSRLATMFSAVKSAAQLSPSDALRVQEQLAQLLTTPEATGAALLQQVDQDELTEWQRVDEDPKRHGRFALHRAVAESLLSAGASLEDQLRGETVPRAAVFVGPITHLAQEVLHPAVREAQSILQAMVREGRSEPAAKLRDVLARCSSAERVYLAAKWLQQSEKSHLRVAREPLTSAMTMLIGIEQATHVGFLGVAGKALATPKDPHSVLHRVEFVQQQLRSASPSLGAEALLAFHVSRCRAFAEMVWAIHGSSKDEGVRRECAERLLLVGQHEVVQSFGRLRTVFAAAGVSTHAVQQEFSPFERFLAAARFAERLSSATTAAEQQFAEAGLLSVIGGAPWHPHYGSLVDRVLQPLIAAGLRDATPAGAQRRTLSVHGAVSLIQTVAAWPLPSTEPLYDLCLEALACQAPADRSIIALTLSQLAGRASVVRNLHLHAVLRTSAEELRSAVKIHDIEERLARAFEERRTPLAEHEVGPCLGATLPSTNAALRRAALSLLRRSIAVAAPERVLAILSEAGLITSHPAVLFTQADESRRFPLAAYPQLRSFFDELASRSAAPEIARIAESLGAMKKGVAFTQLAVGASEARASLVLSEWAPQLDERALRFVVEMSEALSAERASRLLEAAFPNDARCVGRDHGGAERLAIERTGRVDAQLAGGGVERVGRDLALLGVLAPHVTSAHARMRLLTSAHQWRRALSAHGENLQAIARIEAGVLHYRSPLV